MLIFCIVLFLYLHIFFHLKTSNDLEVYEIDQPSKDKLEEICDLRQPVIFNYESDNITSTCNKQTVLDTYGAFDVKIRNTKTHDDDLYIPLSFSSALKVVNEDKESKYLVESNEDFLEETSLIKSYRYNDAFFRPYMISNSNYDFMMASEGTQSPLRYDINYRNYIMVLHGNVKVKLTPPKSSKYLYEERDYENFEFRSPLNPWNIQTQYKPDFDKIKMLEIIVPKGQVLFIPAYWWYSMEFTKETVLLSFKYKTYMNTISILPRLMMRFLQSQNIKREIVQKKNITTVDSNETDNE